MPNIEGLGWIDEIVPKTNNERRLLDAVKACVRGVERIEQHTSPCFAADGATKSHFANEFSAQTLLVLREIGLQNTRHMASSPTKVMKQALLDIYENDQGARDCAKDALVRTGVPLRYSSTNTAIGI